MSSYPLIEKENRKETLCLPRKTTCVNNPLENDIEAAPLHKICNAEPWKWLKPGQKEKLLHSEPKDVIF